MKSFNKQELAKYNGKDGMPVFFAYDGRVYDVTASFLWRNGSHQVLHNAGEDLTDVMAEAPHGDEFIEKFPVVGTYVDA
jgi:predicted heme/steroid binding protein